MFKQEFALQTELSPFIYVYYIYYNETSNDNTDKGCTLIASLNKTLKLEGSIDFRDIGGFRTVDRRIDSLYKNVKMFYYLNMN